LFCLIARNAGVFIAEAEIESEARCDFPIVLNKPVNGRVVVRGAAGSGATQCAVGAVGNEVIDEGV
jgi:hypothetical protein